ncbi:hypothetical protein B0H14DRAFT_2619695 [Mycena olivaceomarginata]|nr:hypothetical protein B0H14DRAFT_2619695 [Mycena olivaceomarginata]
MSYYATDNDMLSATDNYAWMGTTDPSTWPHPFSYAMWGQRDFAAAVLLPHAAAAAAALQEQSAAVEPAAHVELLYTTRHSAAVLQHQNTSKHCAAVVGSTLQRQSWHFAVAVGLFQRQSTACCSSMATLGGHDSTAILTRSNHCMLKYMAALEVGFRSASLGILGPCVIPQHVVHTSLIFCEIMGQEFPSTASGEGKTWTIYYKT